MIRAVFFDFYGVWLPDIFAEYLELGNQQGLNVSGELEAAVGRYFQGELQLSELVDNFRFKLNRPDIDTSKFMLSENNISPLVTEFMRNLHGHFLKLGVLANLGPQEYELLTNYNNHNQLFEVIAGPLAFGMKTPLLSQDVFARALQTIGEPPRSCLAVTGSLTYQRFAESLGIRTLPFEGLASLEQSLEQVFAAEAAGN